MLVVESDGEDFPDDSCDTSEAESESESAFGRSGSQFRRGGGGVAASTYG